MIMRVHDLLEIDAQAFIEASPSAPGWVVESLHAAPFVVVRRAPQVQGLVAVGVRGEARNQRWAGACVPSSIRSVLTPVELMSRAQLAVAIAPSARQILADSGQPGRHPAPVPLQSRFDTVPALRSLTLLADNPTWSSLPHTWGPGGSVGFELATGRSTASLQSDLDLVIYANARLSAEEARRLQAATQNLPSAVDVRVETPVCGFSLTEYASQAPAPILLRTTSGVMLGSDPWA